MDITKSFMEDIRSDISSGEHSTFIFILKKADNLVSFISTL